MKLTIDFETRSACDIKKHGAWVYSEHPTTEVLCLAVKIGGHSSHIIRDVNATPYSSEEIRNLGILLERAATIEAHNAQFEYAIWTNVCVKTYGWPPLPVEKLRCSAAKAAMHSLPRSLEQACQALGLSVQKDMEGYRLMMKMCRPRKPRKGEPELNADDPHGLYWHEDPKDLERLYQYCMHDVEAEEALSNALRDLPEKELKVWHLDLAINARGIQADVEAAEDLIVLVATHEERMLQELAQLTNGAVRTAKQVEVLRGYLRGLGVDLPDLAAATVKDALEKEEISGDARVILEIRKSLGRSSSAKYQAIIDRASMDGRVRGSLLYHGAGTGRWSGAGIQPQNFPSRIKIDGDPESILRAVSAGGIQLFEALYDDDPMAAAGAITRSCLMAAPGKELVVADLSAIEGRMLAWLAGEEWVLEAYRAHKDMYVVAASSILGIPEEKITKDQRQSPGKIAELACGYQGGPGAVRKFGGGEGMDDEEIRACIVTPWREARPNITAFWAGLEEACMNAVLAPGGIFSYRAISYKVANNFLMCRLPSGRLLYYYAPDVRPMKTSWGSMKDCVTYMTVDGMTKKWVRTNTYGGKCAENVTQAASRDIMVEGMFNVEAAGYPIVMTVHDEIISEVPEGYGSVEEFINQMCVTPSWAKGLPLKASGFRAKRYRKD